MRINKGFLGYSFDQSSSSTFTVFFIDPDLLPLSPLSLSHHLEKKTTDVVMHGLMDTADASKATTSLEKEFGVRASFSNADVTKPAEIRAMIEETQRDLGSLDILCNNVGIQHVESVVDFPEEK